MADSGNIDKKIKEGFESINLKAPDDLWSNISAGLSEDVKLDQQIKLSFEKKKGHHAPQGIWERIDKQLTIDKGWTGIHRILRRRTFYRLSKRIVAFGIFLFLVFPENMRLSADFGINVISSSGQSNEERSFTENLFVDTNGEKDFTELQVSDSKKFTSKSDQGAGFDVSKSKSKSESYVLNDKFAPNDLNTRGKKGDQFIDEDSNTLSKEKFVAVKVSDKLRDNEDDLQFEDLSETALPLNLPYRFSTTLVSNIVPGQLIETSDPTSKKTKFEAGIYSALNTTAILNNKTRRALDSESLISFEPSLGTNIGIQFVKPLTKNHALTGNFTYATVKQKYGEFDKGKYLNEKLTVNYFRFQAMYEFRYKRFDINKAGLSVKCGPYAGILSGGSYEIDDSVNKKFVDNFKDTDFGITLQVGQTYEYNKFIIDYGLNVDKGLSNLNSNESSTVASYNRTTLLGLGTYFSFRYKF